MIFCELCSLSIFCCVFNVFPSMYYMYHCQLIGGGGDVRGMWACLLFLSLIDVCVSMNEIGDISFRESVKGLIGLEHKLFIRTRKIQWVGHQSVSPCDSLANWKITLHITIQMNFPFNSFFNSIKYSFYLHTVTSIVCPLLKNIR